MSPLGRFIGRASLVMLLGAASSAPAAETLWTRAFDHDVGRLVLADCGAVIAETPQGLMSLDLATGRTRWIRAEITKLERVPDGRHALVPLDGIVVIVDLETGRNRWSTGGLTFTSVRGVIPVADLGVVLVFGASAQSAHTLMAVDLHSGEVRWRQDGLYAHGFKTDDVRDVTYSNRQPPLVAERLLVLDPTHDGLIALDAATGDLLWRTTKKMLEEPGARAEGSAGLLVADGRVFVPHGKMLSALSATDGRLLWRSAQNLPSRVAQMELTPEGLLVRGSHEIRNREVKWHPYLMLLDPVSGAIRWSTTALPKKYDGRSPFLVENDRVVVALEEGLTSFDLATGAPGPLTSMREFRGSEVPLRLERLAGGRFLLASSQNARVLDLAGHVIYERYYSAPGPGTAEKVGWMTLFAAVAATGITPPIAEFFARYKETASAGPHLFMLTDDPDPSGREGVSLVRIEKATGQETGRVWFTTRSPKYDLDPDAGLVVAADGSLLTVSRFDER